MPLTRFKVYTPGDKPYSRRRTEEEWEPHRQLLTEMHAQRYTRKEMLAKLRELGFEVSSGQLLSQMKKWDMMVYGERVSQSGISPQQLPDTVLTDTIVPININGGLTGDLVTTSTDELPLYPLSTEDSTSESQMDATALQNDPVLNQSPSLSPGVTADMSGLQGEGSHDTSYLFLPPPEYSLEDPSTSHQTIPLLEVETADASSILEQIATITEPWCGNFPTTCCCHALFSGKNEFEKSPKLYKTLMNQSSPQSLMYVMALLNLAGTKPTGDSLVTLRRKLCDALESYLQICTRVDYKNKLAPHILHRLLKVWEDFSDGENAHFPGPELTRYYVARTNEVLWKKVFTTRPAANHRGKVRASCRAIKWQHDTERDVGCVVGFTVRKPSTFPLLNCEGEIFGSTSSWRALEDGLDETQKPLTELLPTAKHIASYMYSRWFNGLVMHTAYDLGDCDLPLIFTALGMMIALEASSSASNLIESPASNHTTWTPGIRAFIETTISTLSLNADYADKFRKAYWLIRCNKIGHGGKTVHMGVPCRATHEWEVLERDIHAYDEERTWIERRIFSGRSHSNPDSNMNYSSTSNNDTWLQSNDYLPATTNGDAMSIRSTSSINSFRRFQALALHLKIGTPMSRSLKSKSTRSGMSTESHLSWQLEQMLEIRDDDVVDDSMSSIETGGDQVQDPRSALVSTETTLDTSRRAQEDQVASDQMQTTET